MRSAAGRRLAGIFKWCDADQGWGVITSPELSGDCFVHFSDIQAGGFRTLHGGQQVTFTYEAPGFSQDSCRFRALAAWPDASSPATQ